MPELILKSTGKPVFVTDEGLADAISSGLYETPSGDQEVNVEIRPGLVGKTTVRELGTAQASGATAETEQSFRGRERSVRIEREHGGPIGTATTFLESGLNEATLGATGALGELIGGDEYTERRLEREEANPIASGLGTAAGIIGTTIATGGAGTVGTVGRIARATPLGAATRLGARVAKTAEGASFATKAGRAALGGAIEGGIVGAGQGVQNLTDTTDPLTWEFMTSELSSGFLTGASTGAAFGAGGKVLEKGLKRARAALDEAAAGTVRSADVADDLAKLDAKGLRAARDVELDALHGKQVADRAAARSAVVDDAIGYRRQVQEANPWLVIDEGEAASQLNKAKRSLRAALDDPKGLRGNPHSLLKPLRHEEQALEAALAKREAIATKLESVNKRIAKDLGEELATLPDAATHVDLSGKAARRYASFAGVKVGKSATVSVARADAETFLDALQAGKVSGASQQAFDALGGLLEKNRGLQAKIEQAMAPLVPKAELASERLKQIADATDALAGGGGPKSLPQQMLEGAAFSGATAAAGTVLGPLAFLAPMAGAKASQAIGRLVFNKMPAAAAAANQRMSKAVSAFLDLGEKAAPAATPIATKVLASVAFAPSKEAEREKPTRRKKSAPTRPQLPELYAARAGEIRSQVAPGPDGRLRMRPEARAAVARRLDPIALHSPMLADRMEALAARRIEFLAAKLPRKPEFDGMEVGPSTWRPSDMEMRTWARYVAAVEDPGAIEERLVHGSVTPEDAEVLREVYPERLAELKRQILAHLPELKAKLPYRRRLALSILSGIAVDPVLDPRVLAALQASYSLEEGTEAGTQAPRPQPQFASVSREPLTPAQERASL